MPVCILPQGDWDGSSATLQLLMNAKKAKNYPIINHGRARGLLQVRGLRAEGWLREDTCAGGGGRMYV